MTTKKLISGLLVLCLVLGLCARNTEVYAADAQEGYAAEASDIYDYFDISEYADSDSLTAYDPTSKTGAVEIEGTVEEYDMTVGEYLALTRDTDAAPNSQRHYGNGVITGDDTQVSSDGNSKYRFTTLTLAEKKLYNRTVDKIDEFVASAEYTTDLTDPHMIEAIVEFTEEERAGGCSISRVFEAIYSDEFSYYWLRTIYNGGNFVTNGVITGAKLQVYVDPYYYTYASRKSTDEALTELIDDWYEELYAIRSQEDEDTKTDYMTVLRLHDLIINRIDYVYDDGGAPQSAQWAHSIAGVGTKQGVVCEGYAKMFSYMLNLLGIENFYITGDTDGGRHAWNAVYIDDCEETKGYYLCDVTWDDQGANLGSGLNKIFYNYFCLPVSEFGQTHTAEDWSYPAFSECSDYVFYRYFRSYAAETLTSETVQTLVDAALGSQYEYSDYVQFWVPDYTSYDLLISVLGHDKTNGFSSPDSIILFYESVSVTNPAETLDIVDPAATGTPTIILVNPDGTPVSTGALDVASGAAISPASEAAILAAAHKSFTPGIALHDTYTFTAQLPDGSDDRVAWSLSDERVATLKTDGRSVTVRGKRNGIVELIATTYAGKAVDSVTIVVGSGPLEADVYIWAGGSKNFKKTTLTPTIKATNWTDAKGNIKQGKLVWITADTPTEVRFDATKHTVLTKAVKNKISVDAKGAVTAKKPGLAYVYVCDTGSMTYETITVGVRLAPDKIATTTKADSFDKKDVLKNALINVGYSGLVYIASSSKLGEPDCDCTYTVTFAKEEQSRYIILQNVQENADGSKFFLIHVRNFDSEKLKPQTVKFNIVNDQSGKKVTLNVKVGNPVRNVTATKTTSSSGAGTTELASKNNTVNLKLEMVTGRYGLGTTDKLKLYVGKTSVSLKTNGKSVQVDKGATIGASVVKNSAVGPTVEIQLKAKKDAGAPAVVYAAFTDALTKEVKLFHIANVNDNGEVSLADD